MHDLEERLRLIAAAETRLRATVESFDESALRRPSLCSGWTRGHVLAHVALNAHSLVNLMQWARTGVETPQYPGWDERDADIERYSARTRDEHLAALAEGSAAFASAARAVPQERWTYEVRGIGGDPTPLERFLFGRLREIEIHHVDLDSSYGPRAWDESFVRAVLEEVPGRLGPRARHPFTIRARDLELELKVGRGTPQASVEGEGAALLAWLLGRSDGTGLVARGALPPVPRWG